MWFDWDRVLSWEMVLLRAGRRMTGSGSVSMACVCVVLQVSKWFILEEEETERRREERGDLREVSVFVFVSGFVAASGGAMEEGGVSMTPLLEENWVSRLEGVMGRDRWDCVGISYPGSDRVWRRGTP